MQALSLASGFELVRINTPTDAVNALKNSDYQKQAMAERDARWIYGLVAAVFILIGWFWQIIRSIFANKRLAKFRFSPKLKTLAK
jgi:hypothetical protein